MQQVFLSRDTGNLNTGSTAFNGLICGGTTKGWNTTEANREFVCPAAGTFKNLKVLLSGTPGSGKSYAFTIRKNEADGAVTTTVSDLNTSNKDTTNTVAVVAGDRLTLSCVPSGTPTARTAKWSAEFVGTTANENIYGSYNVSASGGATTDQPILGSSGSTNTGTRTCEDTITHACTIKAFYVDTDTNVSQNFRILKNATSQGATIVTLSAAKTGNVTGLSIAVSAGDRLSIQSSAQTNAVNYRFGVLLSSTTDGESTMCWGVNGVSLDTGTTDYLPIEGLLEATVSSVESTVQIPSGVTSFTLKNLYVGLRNAPGLAASGKSFAFTARQNTADTAITTTILETATSGNDTTHSVTVAEDDLINFKVVPANTPSSAQLSVSFTQYISPSGGSSASSSISPSPSSSVSLSPSASASPSSSISPSPSLSISLSPSASPSPSLDIPRAAIYMVNQAVKRASIN